VHRRTESSIWNGVDIFVDFFTTPISILNLTTSSKSQERVVSNDILSERKYSQLFTHESNIFLFKQLSRAAMTPRRSLFIDCCSQKDGIKHYNISAVHCVHLADINMGVRFYGIPCILFTCLTLFGERNMITPAVFIHYGLQIAFYQSTK